MQGADIFFNSNFFSFKSVRGKQKNKDKQKQLKKTWDVRFI